MRLALIFSILGFTAVIIGLFLQSGTASSEKVEKTQQIKVGELYDLSQLPEPNLEKSKRAFRRCASCHMISPEGRTKTGPNLWNVYQAQAGHREEYEYSKALQNSNIIWDDAHLAAFLSSPRHFIPGNRMSFAGIRNPQELSNILAYLKEMRDTSKNPPNEASSD